MHLEYLPAQFLLAEAVPEERKITPAAHTFTSFAKSVNVSVCGAGMVGAKLRNACAIIKFAISGCGFLQILLVKFLAFRFQSRVALPY
jgi:hypothetical protein